MEKVLNRGLNFAIMPLKLNLTHSFKCDTDGLHVLQVGQLIEGFLLVLNNIYKVLNTHASGILEAM